MTFTDPDTAQAEPSKKPRSKGVIAGVGIALACAAACALPLVVAGGAVAGAAAIAEGWWWVAAIAFVAVGAVWLSARRRARTTGAAGGCAGTCSVPSDGSAGCGCRTS